MRKTFSILGALSLFFAAPLFGDEARIRLASTTSTENSGLYDEILPQFTKDTGLGVDVISVGTGKALKLGERGDVDAVLVHHRPSEDAFMAAGFGAMRLDVMYNDYVILGPKNDPADVKTAENVEAAFQKIEAKGALFVTRGDDSGTYKREQELWALAERTPDGPWYLDVGRGMGGALNVATERGAYILSDRGTWLSFQNKGDLEILFEGDPPLLNYYGLILVNPERHPHINFETAKAFGTWLTGARGQKAIAGFRIEGEPLFFPVKSSFPDGNS